MPVLCPVAGAPGRRVSSATLRSLVREERAGEIDGRDWFYCDLPDCEVVYFAADGTTIPKGDLKVRVGAKEAAAPRPVCYCFGHSAESIRDEIVRTGQSTVAASVTARVKAGECHCETMNPKGTCCLADIHKTVREVFVDMGAERPSSAPANVEAGPREHDCCAPPTEPPSRTGILAAGASVLSAILATACCWLPLLLAAFGASAAGASAAFERTRPFFLALAPIFLGFGFYSAYFRKEACAPGSACVVTSGTLRRLNRAMLWIAAVVVLAVAFFPNYVGLLFRRGHPPATESETGPTRTILLRIDGMTCEACAPHVEDELAAVPGVVRATVRYADGDAVVTADASRPPDLASLVAAVEKAGYRVRPEPGR